jgi:hypothetical protein
MRGSPSTCSTRRATRISAQWDFRGHLPHPDCGRQRGDGLGRRAMAPKGHRGADAQALRGLPLARRADHHLCQQARPRGPRPFDLLDEIEQALALDVAPASWPIGIGRDFLGTYDLFADALLLFERGVDDRVTEPVRCSGLDDPQLSRLFCRKRRSPDCEEIERAKGLCSRSTSSAPTSQTRQRPSLPMRQAGARHRQARNQQIPRARRTARSSPTSSRKTASHAR